ncbi:MAG: DUF2589 domain-containing protein [Lachnospira sp.]
MATRASGVPRSGEKQPQEKDLSDRKKKNGDSNIRDCDFIPLDELVYAPLHALAESNQRLRTHAVDAIKSMGTVKQNGQEEIIHLDNINIAYDQVRQEGEDGYNVDNLQLQIPILSVVPVTNLSVERAEIDFATEVRSDVDKDGKVKIYGRICSPEQRNSNFLPRVSYHMEIKSIPATEGIMRLTDLLSSNQIAKQLDTTPVAVDGNLCTEEQKNTWQEITDLKTDIKKLKLLHHKVIDTLTEQEKLYQISRDAYEEETYQFDRNMYMKAQSDIMNRIMEAQEKIVTLELTNGLGDTNNEKK